MLRVVHTRRCVQVEVVGAPRTSRMSRSRLSSETVDENNFPYFRKRRLGLPKTEDGLTVRHRLLEHLNVHPILVSGRW